MNRTREAISAVRGPSSAVLWDMRKGGDVDSGDKLDLSVDAKRPAIQPKPAFLNFPAQGTR